MRRRQFLTLSAGSLGGMLVYTLERKAIRVHAQDHEPATSQKLIKVPLRFFTEQEALAVSAAAAQIFPIARMRALRIADAVSECVATFGRAIDDDELADARVEQSMRRCARRACRWS